MESSRAFTSARVRVYLCVCARVRACAVMCVRLAPRNLGTCPTISQRTPHATFRKPVVSLSSLLDAPCPALVRVPRSRGFGQRVCACANVADADCVAAVEAVRTLERTPQDCAKRPTAASE